MATKKRPPAVIRCPDCGKVISLLFPLHGCPAAPPDNPNHLTNRSDSPAKPLW